MTSSSDRPTDDPSTAERAIRSYLLALADPASLVDADAIAALEHEVATATDPIAKLRALAGLERARTIDLVALERGFAEHAKAWADAEGIGVAAFRELGVPDAALRAAGLVGSSTGPSSRPTATRQRTSAPGSNVTARTVAEHVRTISGTFTFADLVRDLGASPITVRKAVAELTDAGDVVALGPDPDHHGRGRAPLRFRRVRPA